MEGGLLIALETKEDAGSLEGDLLDALMVKLQVLLRLGASSNSKQGSLEQEEEGALEGILFYAMAEVRGDKEGRQ